MADILQDFPINAGLDRVFAAVSRPHDLNQWWTLTRADADWTGSTVGFELSAVAHGTHVRFYHLGWPAPNAHYRTSSHCWALYLRLLRRYLEHGEVVPYEDRLNV